ncbi:arylsulfatase [Oleiharenicola lentus]|uniref:Arylsulfatase n=1 Tax=Oleiharenicola lentus TaxID=2508720 RepID=A0A4V1M6S5_9BACT|nr:sulfatase [Oleiharenicola lentus]RXK56419.1 arylsulfatase [Oleiharenicola lentus]
MRPILLLLVLTGWLRAVPPNIVFMVSDDHSVPHIGAYGFPVRTPNLDRLAAQGVLFDRMFTTAPQCAPSRASFATGRSAVAARVTRFSSPLPRDIETFPEILRREAGYFTGICRRSHHLDGWTDSANELSPAIWKKHDMLSVPARFDYVNMTGDRTSTPGIVREFLDRVPAAKPFFLWINFNDPHHPWNAPKVHEPSSLPMPADWPDLPELRGDFARYLDEISRLDEEVQWVLDELERRGLAQNTIVVFVGDNGSPLPRGKGALHERGVNVPLIVRWPAGAPAGRRTPALVSGEDFAPTFLEATGLQPPRVMTGRSFLPLLRNDDAYRPREHLFAMRGVHGASIFNESTPSSGFDLGRMVREDRYKLIINYTPWMPYAPTDSRIEPGWHRIAALHGTGKLDPRFSAMWFRLPRPIVELYDMEEDPAEMNNLAGKPEVAAIEYRLKTALQEKMITEYDYLPLPLRE